MIWRIYDIVKLGTFMLLKLVLFLCLAQGYTKSEKEKLSEYGEKGNLMTSLAIAGHTFIRGREFMPL